MSDKLENNQDEITLKDFLNKIQELLKYIKIHWIKIVLLGIIGGGIGLGYAWLQPITYTAKLTFVVEDGKSSSSSLGGLASLAGQFGVDVGSSSGGGLLSGDNILLYFKSASLAREVLLSELDSASNLTIADAYADVYKLNTKWKENKNIGPVKFQKLSMNKPYTRLQDSLLQSIVKKIITNNFSVERTDKKAGFIQVTSTMENEMLAKVYCDRIVEKAVQKYISIKILRQKTTVEKLQARVDSIARLLNQKTISSAGLQTKATTMDINPLYKQNSVVANETTMRDKTMLATIFSSVTQNLEIAKFTLSQETPVIQIIDNPIYPLQINQTSKKMGLFLGGLIGGVLMFIIILVRKIIADLL